MPLITEADKIALGGTLADKVYLGSNLIWEPETSPPADPLALLFAGGQQGMVMMPGSQWTDCYVEATGTPPATKCTHGTTVGTIHDKVRNTYTRISTANQRPTYQIVNGKHSLIFNGSTTLVPLTGGANISASAVDAVFGLNLNGDAHGILLVGANDDYIGVWYQWWSDTNLANHRTLGSIPVSLRVSGHTDPITDRDKLYWAMSTGDKVVTAQVQQNFSSMPWRTGTYEALEYNNSIRLYGLVIRFSAPFSTDERATVESVMTGQLP